MKYDASEIAAMPKPSEPPCVIGKRHSWKIKMRFSTGLYSGRSQICRHCKKQRKVSVDIEAGTLYWYYDEAGTPFKWPPGYPPYPNWRNINKKEIAGMRPEIPPELAKRFRRACPVWAKHILDDPYDYEFPSASFVDSDGKRWSLTEPHSCIVGETHDRNTNHLLYGCEACAGYATALMEMRDLNWPEILSRFLDHYEKSHLMEAVA